MPNHIFKQVKEEAARRGTTFRALVVNALERDLERGEEHFKLRDVSAGPRNKGSSRVSVEAINEAIDSQREPGFRE